MKGRLLVSIGMAMLCAMTPSIAAAGPPEDTAMISSWSPEAVDGSIVGGDQTLTVMNLGTESLGELAIDLDPAPCECVRTRITVDGGRMSANGWVVSDLAAGASASISIRYDQRSASPFGNPPDDGIGLDSSPARPTVVGLGTALFTAV